MKRWGLELDTEIWRPVVGWCGLYEVSTHGRIRSLDRVTNGPLGSTRVTKGRVKALRLHDGYQTVTLHDKGRCKTLCVNRAMLQVFRPAINERDLDSCHNNGNRADNRLDNLRWDTRNGNLKDMDIHGTRIRGDAHPSSKMTESQVRLIRDSEKSNHELAGELGISEQMVRRARNGTTWRHVA